jgi:hypothetical protein
VQTSFSAVSPAIAVDLEIGWDSLRDHLPVLMQTVQKNEKGI